MLTALRVTEGPAPPGWTEPGASVTEAAVGRPGGSAACESIAQWVGSWSNGATPTGTPMAAATEATEQRCQQVRCSGRVEEKSTRRLQAQSAGGPLGRVQHSRFFQYHLLKRVCVPPCMLYLTLLKTPGCGYVTLFLGRIPLEQEGLFLPDGSQRQVPFCCSGGFGGLE